MSGLTPERWEQVSAILDEVLELPADEVSAYLDTHCPDADLRAEVEVMIDACARAEHLMERPPALNVKGMVLRAEAAAEDRGKLGEGDLVGAYRIVDLLGRGGMGAVYLAERADGQFEKQVALKVVKRGMDSEEIVERFWAERQILAGLEHPHIAGLLDGGITDDGRPYFAMELADGDPIDEYCDRLRLPLRKRIELFLVVCDAVQHAHRNLVVHRDLKPGNILVTPQGEVKLLDFGIAKVLDPRGGSADRTRMMGVRLTPEYAAPEQIVMGPTTTATDVYALGVILYELLSGKRPYVFTSESMSEIEDVVCRTEPRRPSTRVVFRDSDTGSSSSRDSGAREETGGLPRSSWLRSTNPGTLRQGLSGDLDSIVLKALEKEPQRRYGSAAELRQDLENYLRGLPVEARAQTGWYRLGKFVRRNRVVVALASAAVVALITGAGVATAFGVEAQRSERLADAAAERARRTGEFLVTVFESFDPNETDGRELNSRNVVTRALAQLDTITGQPLLKAESLSALGRVAFNLGERPLADSIFQESLRILDDNDIDNPTLTALDLSWRGRLLNEREVPEAIDLLRRAIALHEANPERDDELYATDLMELAFALTVHESAGETRLDESEALLERAAALGLDARMEGRRLEYLADVAFTRGDADAALDYGRRSLAVRERALPPNHPELGRSHLVMGFAYARALGEADSARAAFQKAVEIFEGSLGSHPFTASARYQLARALHDMGEFRAAIPILTAVIDTLDPDERTDLRTLAVAHYALARSYYFTNQFERAEEQTRIAARYLPRIARLASTEARNEHLLGLVLGRMGRYTEASAVLDGLLQQPDLADGLRDDVLIALVDFAEAEGRLQDARRYRALLAAPGQGG